MKIDWIFKAGVKVCPNLRPIVFLEDEVVPSGDVVAMTCLEPGMVFRGAAVLTCFAWLLSFPSCGWLMVIHCC
jgi:hypothetical protein